MWIQELEVQDSVRLIQDNIDTTLIPPGTQYAATLCRVEQRNPLRNAACASLWKPVQRLTAHSYEQVSGPRMPATQLSFLIGCRSPTNHTALDVGCRFVLPRLLSLGAAKQLNRAPWDTVNEILKDCGYPKGP
jgi:hypothetical protein